MASKWMRKLVKVMIIELVILLFIVDEANDLSLTSSLLSMLHNLSKLGNKIIKQGLFFQYVTGKTHICLQIPGTDPWDDFQKKFALCISDAFQNFFSKPF